MIYRRLDSEGDMTFGSGKGNFLSEIEAVAQAIKTRLLLFQAEWWLDREDGLPFFQQISGYRGRDKAAVERIITERILGTQHVTGISYVGYDYDADSRQYSFTATVDTDYGAVVITNAPPFAAGMGA